MAHPTVQYDLELGKFEIWGRRKSEEVMGWTKFIG
jgi:hypothetical protein